MGQSQGPEGRFHRWPQKTEAVSIRHRPYPCCSKGSLGELEEAAEGRLIAVVVGEMAILQK
jgi:hypothetical protein